MKRTILAACLAGTCAVALSAQTPSPQSPTQQPPTSTTGTSGATTSPDQSGSQRSRGGPMTITGCLKAGDTAETFMLTNVKGMGRPTGTTGDTSPSTTGGATTSPESGARGMSEVTLMPASDVDLKAHVGHTIEVTGTPARGGAGAGGTTAGGTTTGGTTAGGTTAGGTTAGGATAGGTSTGGAGAAATSGHGRSLNVTKVKMVSETCSQ
jgi:hypothetical protein